MNRNSYKHRNKYYQTIFITIFVVLISLLGITVYANFDMLKRVFTYTPPEAELPENVRIYNSVMYRIQKLEELSFAYDKENYQLRVLTYIRSDRYNDEIWSKYVGEVDVEFTTYIHENQGDLNIEELRSIEYLNIPQSNTRIDFVHMIATLNSLFSNGQSSISDMCGWAGDLVQLMAQYKDTELTGEDLVNAIKSTFNGGEESVLGSADINADFDAVNIYNNYLNSSVKSLYLIMQNYFENMTSKSRIKMFNENMFEDVANVEDLSNEVLLKLNNDNIDAWLMIYGVDDGNYNHIIEACAKVFANYIFENTAE